ncbi:MAG TPA: mechanosensitive ion channel family protein [Mucilaginibacter sp.]|jgi:small conductance mechanosensitive channel|nr:mechanosensitive ion channel family protein [Mucilaginibacter sp.]
MKPEEFYHQFHVWLVENGQNYIFGIIVFAIGYLGIRFVKTRLRARMARNSIHSSLRPFFQSLTIIGLYVLLILTVFRIIGFELSFLSAIVASFGVAAGLALSGTFQNFAGGVLILMLKPFNVGDDIVAQGQEGTVTSIQLFYTVVITYDNRQVIIPNGKLFNEVIVNINREQKRRIDFELKLGYIVEVDQVKDIIEKAIKTFPAIMHKPVPLVGVIALELDGIRFTVRVWVHTKDFLDVKIKLQEKIVKDLREADVKLPTHHLMLPGT